MCDTNECSSSFSDAHAADTLLDELKRTIAFSGHILSTRVAAGALFSLRLVSMGRCVALGILYWKSHLNTTQMIVFILSLPSTK